MFKHASGPIMIFSAFLAGGHAGTAVSCEEGGFACVFSVLND